MKRSFTTHSEEETISAGFEFGRTLSAGGVVACFGELGTGKTRFIKGICKGLGVSEHVSSPTFTIVNEYSGRMLKVYHFDFYRMHSESELREIGFEDYIFGDGVCVIEWADRVRDLLPPNRFDVFLELGDDDDSRKITITEIAEVTA